MTFDWWTFALQAVNFLVLVWLLNRFLYKPVSAAIERRREEIAHAQAEAEAARQAADQTRAALEERLAQSEAERRKLIEGERARMDEERRQVLEKARAEVERLQAESVKRLGEETQTAVGRAFDQTVEIAIELAKRLLVETSAESIEEAFLHRILAHLDRMSNSHPESLRGRLFNRDDTGVTVTTAHELNSAEQGRWRDELVRRIGDARVSFSVAPDLIAGSEVRFPLATLSFNWRDALAAARREMVRDEPNS